MNKITIVLTISAGALFFLAGCSQSSSDDIPVVSSTQITQSLFSRKVEQYSYLTAGDKTNLNKTETWNYDSTDTLSDVDCYVKKDIASGGYQQQIYIFSAEPQTPVYSYTNYSSGYDPSSDANYIGVYFKTYSSAGYILQESYIPKDNSGKTEACKVYTYDTDHPERELTNLSSTTGTYTVSDGVYTVVPDDTKVCSYCVTTYTSEGKTSTVSYYSDSAKTDLVKQDTYTYPSTDQYSMLEYCKITGATASDVSTSYETYTLYKGIYKESENVVLKEAFSSDSSGTAKEQVSITSYYFDSSYYLTKEVYQSQGVIISTIYYTYDDHAVTEKMYDNTNTCIKEAVFSLAKRSYQDKLTCSENTDDDTTNDKTLEDLLSAWQPEAGDYELYETTTYEYPSSSSSASALSVTPVCPLSAYSGNTKKLLLTPRDILNAR